jgi:hypothetical protein
MRSASGTVWIPFLHRYLPLANCANFCCRAASASCMFAFTSEGMTRAGAITFGVDVVTTLAVEEVIKALGSAAFSKCAHNADAAPAAIIEPKIIRLLVMSSIALRPYGRILTTEMPIPFPQ